MTLDETCICIFTDGSCCPNPGTGGWAAITVFPDGRRLETTGGELRSTNNRMEMMGAIAALEALGSERRRVIVASDSQYLIHGITRWVHAWLRKGWRKKSGQPVLNLDLWQRLLIAARPHAVSWQWVRGHNGHPENERCDRLATGARRSASAQRRASRTTRACNGNGQPQDPDAAIRTSAVPLDPATGWGQQTRSAVLRLAKADEGGNSVPAVGPGASDRVVSPRRVPTIA